MQNNAKTLKQAPKNFLSPKQLATPNNLGKSANEAIAKAINPIIADAFALYIKTKNFHWHLSGPHFRDYHIMFDEQADQIFEMIDVLAERVRKLGGNTIHSIGQISQLQSIEDDNDEFVEAKEMVRRLLEDNKKCAARMYAAHKVCDDNNDVSTASFLEIYIDETERRAWFLFETQAS
ncbi:MAG: DNA starvation/stationary phase protection protein [Parachlamydiaceae bacterium]|nr:DNA starvation/stationary phase protection protein [Parachlamydiaceae bacterium]